MKKWDRFDFDFIFWMAGERRSHSFLPESATACLAEKSTLTSAFYLD